MAQGIVSSPRQGSTEQEARPEAPKVQQPDDIRGSVPGAVTQSGPQRVVQIMRQRSRLGRGGSPMLRQAVRWPRVGR